MTAFLCHKPGIGEAWKVAITRTQTAQGIPPLREAENRAKSHVIRIPNLCMESGSILINESVATAYMGIEKGSPCVVSS